MPVKKRIRSKAKTQKQTSLVASRKMRECRMREIRASLSGGLGTARARHGYGPFWNRGSLALFRSWEN